MGDWVPRGRSGLLERENGGRAALSLSLGEWCASDEDISAVVLNVRGGRGGGREGGV